MNLPRVGRLLHTALIVDDDTMMRLLIRQTLERSGFVCHEAHNGQMALEMVPLTQPDIVLLDVVMPELDGYAVCERLRRDPAGALIPVLMLTGLEDTESINRAYEVGATDFISKPITWGVLAHRVRYILRASAAFRELAKNQASLELAQRIARLGSWEWDLARNEVHWSAQTFRILGLEPDAVTPSLELFLERVDQADRGPLKEALTRLLSSGTFDGRVIRLRMEDGNLRHAQMQALCSLDASGTVCHLSATIQDVTELKEAEQQIRYLAYYDAVTGLPNRQFFMERVQQVLSHARRHNRQFGVLSLDLDQFKRINDSLGHGVGNQLLVAAGKRIAETLRADDTIALNERDANPLGPQAQETVARLDGDEFSLLLTELAHFHDAAKIARRLLEELRRPFPIDGTEMFITASIGLALYPLDGEDAESLVKNAGAAMHFAKEQGRDNYQFYSRAMNATALEKLSMESQLRKALEREEFLLHYQPKVQPSTGRIVGLEALIRWRHPELGMVAPAQFIPVAEETGLIVPVGEWVLREASRQNQKWRSQGFPPMHVAVNIASLHFRHGGLIEAVARALRESGLDPALLELEVTESMLMHSVDTTLETLFSLKDMGVRLAIDDFGTGYSSLSYLKRFPLDTLKIDRSFIKDLPRDAEDAAIARAIIAMAHSLKLAVVAEGVEAAEQLAFLQQHGCDVVQGYLFSRPVSPEDFATLLARPQLKAVV